MDPLHDIVQSLNKAEKRYFRMFAEAFKTGSDIMKLYDCLEGMEVYDEKIVLKKVKTKNLTSLKSQLRKLVLKAMRNYREDDNIGDRVRCALSEIEFLTNKNLRSEARKEINKLSKIVADNEVHYAVAELAMRSVLNSEPEKEREQVFAYIDGKIEELKYAANGMVEMYGAVLFQTKGARYFNSFDYDNPARRNKYLLEFIGIAEERAKTSSSLRARLMYLMAAAGYNYNLKKIAEAGKLYDECLELFDKNPSLFESPKTFYFTVIANYMAFAVSHDNTELMKVLIQRLENWVIELKDFFTINPEVLLRVKVRILSTQISLYHLTNDTKNMDGILPEMEYILENTKFVESQHSLVPVMVLRITATYLMAHQTEKASYWIEKYFLLSTAKAIKLSYQIVRFFEALVFLEKGDFELADNKAMNLYKTITENEREQPFFKEWGRLLRKLGKWNYNDSKDMQELSEVIAELDRLVETPNSSAETFWSIFKLRHWFNHLPVKTAQ